MVKKIFTLLLFTLAFLVNVCSANLKVHMLNVGQGDAFLIQTDEQNILIDTSDVDERLKLERELYRLKAFKIDKLILTHPHADHIGNAAYLVKSGVVKIAAVYDNGIISSSKLYQNYVDACNQRNVRRTPLKEGDILDFGEGCRFIVYHPNVNLVNLINSGAKGNPNNESIVGRLEYGNFSMLFTGDAEAPVEQRLLDKLQPVDVLKAGHHGSKTASSAPFLAKLKPKYVLISAGEPTTKRGGNTYGHPHPQTLQRFLDAAIPQDHIFISFKNGTVSFEADPLNFFPFSP